MILVKGIRTIKLIQALLSSNISLSSENYHWRLSPSRRPESEWILSICLESSFLSLNFDSQYGQETWPSVDIQGYYVCPLHLSWSLWIILYLQHKVGMKKNFKKLYRLQVIKWPWIRPFGLAIWDHHLYLSSIPLGDHLACGTSLDVPCVFHYQFVVYIHHISSGITFATYREMVEF
jgi:hypothetical protein